MKLKLSLKYYASLCLVGLSCSGAWSLNQLNAANSNPENVLPSNAIVHAQIKNPLDLLFQIETFAKNTIPGELAPPPVQGLLQEEHPLLTVLGMQMGGKPLDPAVLEKDTGLDLDADITLTLYPGDPSKFFILSVGLTDSEKFIVNANAMKGPVKVETVSIGGHDMIKANVQMGPLKYCFGLASGNRLYLSGEPSLLLLLKDSEGYSRLSEDPHMSDVIRKADDLDIFVTVHPGLAKPLFSQVGFFKYLPISLLSQQKQTFLNQIPEKEREMIDAQIRMQLPLSGVEELLDYAECVVTALYQSVFDSLSSSAGSFEGITLGIRANSLTPGLTFMMHAGEQDEKNITQPIPLNELKSALAGFPSQANQWSAVGKTPKKVPSVWITKTMDRMNILMETKGLRTGWLKQIRKLHVDQLLLQPMESQTDWMLKVGAKVKKTPQLKDYDSLKTFFTDWTTQQYQPAYRQVVIAPDHGPSLLSDYLTQQKHVLDEGHKQAMEFVKSFQGQGSWIDQIYRVDAQETGRGVSEHTWENVWRTKSGLFGFNEHELIHRRVYLAREVDDYLVYHQDSGDQTWLEDFEWQSGSKLPGSAETLLDIVPEGSHSISFIKLNELLPTLIHGLSDAESLAHRDIHSYLEAVKGALENVDANDEKAVSKAVSSIPFSPLLAAVNRDAETGQVYGLLPGNIAFPRPKLAPLLEDVIEDYEAVAKNVGGIMTYAKHHDNTCEFGIIHHTGGVSALIKTVGNTLAKNYIKNPEGMQTLMTKAMTPMDMNPEKLNQTIHKNPQWLFVEGIQGGIRANNAPSAPRGPKAVAEPQNPIPDRADNTPKNCIPLDNYYNAALDDNFHMAGLEGNDLASFPKGKVELAGITFDARGLVHLNGQQVQANSPIGYPNSVENIVIGRKAKHLHFLHGAGWPSNDDQTVAKWIVYYNDGTESIRRVRYGKDVADWWTAPESPALSGSQTAWEGENGATKNSPMSLRLYKTTWNNPHPDKVISAIDYVSSMKDTSSFLLGITAE
ncbi:MAG: hypothetical protein HOH33_17630 [Verrucomicrobia bacterium]|jgi:hypothetical protein|nr:hypothetical protein [Verrucomicrobiota bacterium]